MPTVLIVDDNDENRYLLKNFFRLFGIHSGIEVAESRNAAEAVQSVKKLKPDLVLLDIRMETDFAGLSAVREIRENPQTSKTVVWALTSQAMEAYAGEKSDRDKCLEAGCDDYISKPYDQMSLLMKISKQLNVPIPDRIRRRMGI